MSTRHVADAHLIKLSGIGCFGFGSITSIGRGRFVGAGAER